jgi:hypothetical protein
MSSPVDDKVRFSTVCFVHFSPVLRTIVCCRVPAGTVAYASSGTITATRSFVHLFVRLFVQPQRCCCCLSLSLELLVALLSLHTHTHTHTHTPRVFFLPVGSRCLNCCCCCCCCCCFLFFLFFVFLFFVFVDVNGRRIKFFFLEKRRALQRRQKITFTKKSETHLTRFFFSICFPSLYRSFFFPVGRR